MYYLPKHHPADSVPGHLLPDQVQPPDLYYGLASRTSRLCTHGDHPRTGGGAAARRLSRARTLPPAGAGLAAVVQTRGPASRPRTCWSSRPRWRRPRWEARRPGLCAGRRRGVHRGCAAVYFVNDVVDADQDRLHPSSGPARSRRAAGPAHALVLAVLGVLAAEAVCLWIGEPTLAVLVTVYVAFPLCTRSCSSTSPWSSSRSWRPASCSRARRSLRDPGTPVRLVPGGVQPGRPAGRHRQALHRTRPAGPGRRHPPARDALVTPALLRLSQRVAAGVMIAAYLLWAYGQHGAGPAPCTCSASCRWPRPCCGSTG